MPGTIRRLDQVRALSDPLRLRIVELLAEEERTVMHIARLLRRKPTSLYHHVRVLEAAGLLREVRSQRKRGTIERYYRAAHAELRIDPRVFGGGRATRARRDVATGVLEAAALDLRRVGSTSQPMLALRLAFALDATRLGEMESVLQAWADGHEANTRSPYHVTLVAHPAGNAAPKTTGAAAQARRHGSSEPDGTRASRRRRGAQ
jgi:DNA-binding transcriptional ArsR family regulator